MLLLSSLNIACHSGKSSVTSKEKQYLIKQHNVNGLCIKTVHLAARKIWAHNELKLNDDFVFNRLVTPIPDLPVCIGVLEFYFKTLLS